MPWVPVLASPEMLATTGCMALLLKNKDKNSPALKMKAYENELFKFHWLLKPFFFFGTQEAGKKKSHLSLRDLGTLESGGRQVNQLWYALDGIQILSRSYLDSYKHGDNTL